MGADIHERIQVKENGVWIRNTDKVFPNSYYRSPEELVEIRIKNPHYELSDYQMNEFDDQPSGNRNYDWFAILADVRNYDGFDVIAPLRYSPKGAGEDWEEMVADGDMHSASYLYLEDFDNFFSADRITTKEGVISFEEYKVLRETREAPYSWCRAVGGPKVVTLTEYQANIILDNPGEKILVPDPYSKDIERVSLGSKHSIYVKYHWTVNYKDWFKSNIEQYVEPMRKLKKKYEDVRYLFCFDN